MTPDLFGLNIVDNAHLLKTLIAKSDVQYGIPSAFRDVEEFLKQIGSSNSKVFESMDLTKQVQLLIEVLKVFQCKPIYGHLKEFGGSTDTAGRIQYNKKIDNLEISMIHQSVTGLFESRMDLREI